MHFSCKTVFSISGISRSPPTLTRGLAPVSHWGLSPWPPVGSRSTPSPFGPTSLVLASASVGNDGSIPFWLRSQLCVETSTPPGTSWQILNWDQPFSQMAITLDQRQLFVMAISLFWLWTGRRRGYQLPLTLVSRGASNFCPLWLP